MSDEAEGQAAQGEAEAAAAEDTGALKNAFERQKADNKALKAKLAELEVVRKQYEGVDLDRVRELEQQAEERERTELESKGKWEELAEKRVAKLAETKDAQIAQIAAERDSVSQQLNQILVVDGFKKELAGLTGFRNEKGVLDDVERFARENIRLVDGVPTPIAGDEPQIGPDGKNKTLTALASEMLKDKSHWFLPSVGGGAQNLNGSGVAGKNIQGLSPVERMRMVHEKRI